MAETTAPASKFKPGDYVLHTGPLPHPDLHGPAGKVVKGLLDRDPELCLVKFPAVPYALELPAANLVAADARSIKLAQAAELAGDQAGPRRTPLGSFWVDTGLVAVGDPAQMFRGDADADRPPPTYQQMTELFGGRLSSGDLATVINHVGDAGAFTIVTGCDGWYHVYLEEYTVAGDDGPETRKRLIMELDAMVEPLRT